MAAPNCQRLVVVAAAAAQLPAPARAGVRATSREAAIAQIVELREPAAAMVVALPAATAPVKAETGEALQLSGALRQAAAVWRAVGVSACKDL